MPVSGPDVLLYEKKSVPGAQGKIVVMTMNRPERMNAVSTELRERLADAWERFDAEDDAWVGIITGAGDKAFCVGQDLAERAERDKAGINAYEAFGTMRESTPPWISKPVIAAINGFAVGGGWKIAQACDIRIAVEHAEMGISETRWNLTAGWVCDLTRQLSLGHALEIALWGDRRISAKRAYEIGWLNRVVPREKLMEEAMSWAERMLYLGPRSVRNIKEILYRCYYMPPEEGRRYAANLEKSVAGMEDTLEGPRAFAEKRSPEFKNR